MSLIPLVDILREKKGKWKEAHLVLFELCNMRCSFCHQDHDSVVGYDSESMFDKACILLEQYDSNTPVVVNITGGELFMDDVPDEFFDTFFDIGVAVLDHFKHVKLVFGTNLVYNNVERVRLLIEDLRAIRKEVWLATSYDPAGRFTGSQRELFLENLEKVKDLVETVNVVITRQNIQMFIDGKEGSEFTQMCEDFDVYFDHYIPSTLYKQHQPDEELISKLYLKLNDTYPNSYPIKSWKQNEFSETTCRSTKIISKDGIVTTCWSEAGKDSILDEAEGLKAKDEAEVSFVNRYGCFECEYYSRCGLRCFLHDRTLENKSKECQIKKVFDTILQ